MKYKITKQDLNKRNYGMTINGVAEKFLEFIAQEEKAKNPILSTANITKLEYKTKRGISINIIVLLVLGLFCLALGLYQFIYLKPLIGVNLYTQFPLISNGSIEIVGSIALMIGCVYSYIKRDAVLERLVKSKLIEDLKDLQKEKENWTMPSKKKKRFRQSFKVGKRK